MGVGAGALSWALARRLAVFFVEAAFSWMPSRRPDGRAGRRAQGTACFLGVASQAAWGLACAGCSATCPQPCPRPAWTAAGRRWTARRHPWPQRARTRRPRRLHGLGPHAARPRDPGSCVNTFCRPSAHHAPLAALGAWCAPGALLRPRRRRRGAGQRRGHAGRAATAPAWRWAAALQSGGGMGPGSARGRVGPIPAERGCSSWPGRCRQCRGAVMHHGCPAATQFGAARVTLYVSVCSGE